MRRPTSGHKVNVEVVEPLGSEQFVYLRSGTQEFTSRMPSRAQLAAGNNVEVIFDTERDARLRQADGDGAGVVARSQNSGSGGGGDAPPLFALQTGTRAASPGRRSRPHPHERSRP